MVRTYRQRRKRKRNITIGSNGLPINVRNLPFTDELRIQCEILEFWYLNPHSQETWEYKMVRLTKYQDHHYGDWLNGFNVMENQNV